MLRAMGAFFTGRMLSVGDSPLADVKDQTNVTNTNTALLSALMLTAVVPLLMDAAPGSETNSHMITDPPWIGSLYFVVTASATWSLAIATIMSILAIVVLNETTSRHEARYLVAVGHVELNSPFKFAALGWVMTWCSFYIFVYIVSWDLGDKYNVCSFKGGAEMAYGCGSFPFAFGLSFVAAWLLSLTGMNLGFKLIAKLYHCRKHISPHVAKEFSAVPASGPWFVTPSMRIVQQELDGYFSEVGQEYAHPDGFKEYIIQRSHAGGLSYFGDALVSKAFDDRINRMVRDAEAQDAKARSATLPTASARNAACQSSTHFIRAMAHSAPPPATEPAASDFGSPGLKESALAPAPDPIPSAFRGRARPASTEPEPEPSANATHPLAVAPAIPSQAVTAAAPAAGISPATDRMLRRLERRKITPPASPPTSPSCSSPARSPQDLSLASQTALPPARTIFPVTAKATPIDSAAKDRMLKDRADVDGVVLNGMVVDENMEHAVAVDGTVEHASTATVGPKKAGAANFNAGNGFLNCIPDAEKSSHHKPTRLVRRCTSRRRYDAQ